MRFEVLFNLCFFVPRLQGFFRGTLEALNPIRILRESYILKKINFIKRKLDLLQIAPGDMKFDFAFRQKEICNPEINRWLRDCCNLLSGLIKVPRFPF